MKEDLQINIEQPHSLSTDSNKKSAIIIAYNFLANSMFMKETNYG